MSQDERSWSRMLLASSGVALDHDERRRAPSQEWLEAGASALARPRLLELAAHRDPGVRETIALRPDCPTGVLATLAFDADRSVRRAVAAHPRIAAAIATELSADRDREVLRALCRNHATPRQVLLDLATHRRPEVRRAAERAVEERHKASQARAEPHQESIPPELRDRWQPPSPYVSPAAGANARAYAPRPVPQTRRADAGPPPHPSVAPASGAVSGGYLPQTSSAGRLPAPPEM